MSRDRNKTPHPSKYSQTPWRFAYFIVQYFQFSQSHKVLMVSYQMAQKRRVRITVDMEVMGDFNPREIDFEKVFKLEPNEKVEAYIEDMDIDW